MKKMVEVEYVGIEDLQDIMDDLFALQKLGHYASLEIRNLYCETHETRIEVSIMLNGWDMNKEYDHHFVFFMNDNEDDVNCMNMCKSILINLLSQEEQI